MGPWNHMKLLTSKERLPFTFIYLLTLSGEAQHNSYWSSLKMIQSSAWAYAFQRLFLCSDILLFIAGTLYFAMALQSTVLTCIAAVAQVDINFFATLPLSDCQCRSRNSPGFDPCILWHSGIWGAADEVLFNTEHRKKFKKSLCL